MTTEIKKYHNGNYAEYRIEVFPGIIIEHYFCEGGKAWNSPPSTYMPKEDILIHHCRYGRFESLLENGSYLSLGMGKMTLSSSLSSLQEVESIIPAELYEGISIVFSYKQFPSWLTALFSTWSIEFSSIISKFNLSKCWYYIAANDEMEKIFLELYDLFDTRTLPLIQLKVLELMYHFSVDTALCGKSKMSVPQTHSKLVKRICAMMIHTTCPITELVLQSNINYNLFQKIFKLVYGTSPSLYRQEYKMNRAASLLKNTDRTVLDIALEQGYENPGKFAAAFKRMMGLTPQEFRKLESPIRLDKLHN
ncbi:helix-turn-helix transcriptional regulator [Treponema denticola]|uniref:Helix-turn-helix transcriptional regulator n=1 Tax=Treponema denticola TaxID=158 RepID=A0A9Q9BMH2_TREDN|nr:AraC family transcriptional regulator [Treponema denticola]UTC90200.1 helix-turn-helix transcriptional regulator [Treponema denticola]UTD00449.1 helix-turn-helix transcriptional regulator [Treponema denticola]UTD05273.1 helix-turn-helix transcriptional regulator [Treponema denticola]